MSAVSAANDSPLVVSFVPHVYSVSVLLSWVRGIWVGQHVLDARQYLQTYSLVCDILEQYRVD